MLPKTVLISVFFALTNALDQKVATIGAWPASQDGAVPIRQNINKLHADGGPQWDLYIQALRMMQDANEDDPFSYFQLAGIHGLPFIEWGNTGGRNNATGWGGYCPHGEAMFLPWHRPYIVLYEQIVVNNARAIAETYPEAQREIYRNAADQLRVPFWDWGVDGKVPDAVVPEMITIKASRDGTVKDVTIPNPLATFVYPKSYGAGKYGPPPIETERVLRCQAPFSFPATANANLQRRNYRQRVYDVFSRAETFDSFGTVGNKGISLESLHNNIHWDAACDHALVAPSTSGFDPIFFLHHANVDRLWAYWGAMKGDEGSLVQPYVGGPRWSTPNGTTINPDTTLQPFFDQNNQWYTITSVADVDAFGYTYEGLEFWRKSDEQMKEDATTIINTLYGPRTPKVRRGGSLIPRATDNTRLFAEISVEASELKDRPCEIEITVKGYKANSIVVLAHPVSGPVYGGFSLDEDESANTFSAQSVEETVSSLDDNMQIAIIKPDGTRLDASKILSLQVDIEEVDVTPPQKDTEMPVISMPRVHEAVRAGKKLPNKRRNL